MASTPLAPLSAGEIVTDALALLRRHFGPVFFTALPFAASDVLLRETGSVLLGRTRDALGNGSHAASQALTGALAMFAAGLAAFAASVMVVQLLTALTTHLTADAWLGRAPQALTALKRLRRVAWRVFTIGALFLLAIVAAVTPSVVLIIIAIALFSGLALFGACVAAAALALFTTAFVTLRVGLYLQACLLEGCGVMAAFARSTDLMRSRGEGFWRGAKLRLSLLLLVTIPLSFAMQGLFALPRYLMALSLGWNVSDAGLPPLTALPVWFGVPFAVIEVATNSAVLPLTGIVMTLFYFDARVRYEGLDVVASPSGAGL